MDKDEIMIFKGAFNDLPQYSRFYKLTTDFIEFLLSVFTFSHFKCIFGHIGSSRGKGQGITKAIIVQPMLCQTVVNIFHLKKTKQPLNPDQSSGLPN